MNEWVNYCWRGQQFDCCWECGHHCDRCISCSICNVPSSHICNVDIHRTKTTIERNLWRQTSPCSLSVLTTVAIARRIKHSCFQLLNDATGVAFARRRRQISPCSLSVWITVAITKWIRHSCFQLLIDASGDANRVEACRVSAYYHSCLCRTGGILFL